MTRLFPRPIAHRGLHDAKQGIAENSRSAFEAAIEHGYAIECDVQLSSDGVAFIFHDDTFERMTNAAGPSGERSIAEVQSLVLTGSRNKEVPQRLTEFLAQVAGRADLQIELKEQPTPERAKALAKAVARDIAGYNGPLTLETFDPRLILALREEGVTAPVGIVTYDWREPEWDAHIAWWRKLILRHVLHWPWTRFDFISCRDNSLLLPAVRLLRAGGMEVTTWTITSDRAARAALQAADQIVFEGYLPAIG
jgi:glycerophosphoryl diester phosphodiesterase